MSKLNQIQTALKELDGGVFQKLGDCYLKEIGYANLNPLGSVFGANKVRKGTPDTVIKKDNGKLVFVEYTTQQDNLFEKLGSDINKCCNEKKTGIKISDIEKIILCYTGKLTLEQEQNLHQKIEGSGIVLELYGIEELSFDLYCKFPGLARDFLGISIDTGQILTTSDFVSSYDSNKFSTPLNTDFYFRKNEIEYALSQLHSNRLLLISGKAGVGKSRLTLEIISQFQNEHPGYKVYCVRDRGQDLFEDLRVYFSKPAKFLILVDDANRISKFDYITHLLHDCKQEQEFKIVVTVRDYAIEKIRNSTQSIDDKSEIFLLPFEKSELKELIVKLFNITNNLWLDRICNIAAGNPRLAMMAAKTAIAANSLESIRDISSLYDQYFSSIKSDLQELNDPDMLIVAGIISFFRTLDKTNEQLMELIYTAFSIDENRLWQSIQRLHELELVDIYENKVVKIADQVLSTYLFYLCVFKNKVINLQVIFEQFFPSQINRIRDAIYSCLNSFDYEQLANQIKPVISEQWSKYKKNNQNDKLHQLIQSFWFFLQTEALSYIHDEIQSMEIIAFDLEKINWKVSNNHYNTNTLLSLLGYFNQADETNFKISLELICKYIEKMPTSAPNVLHLFSEQFGFDRYSHFQNYSKQHFLIDTLIGYTKNGENLLFSKLFILLSEKYLHTRFDDTDSQRGTITFHQCKLLAIQPLLDLRQKIWNHLFKLFNRAGLTYEVINLLNSYSKANYYLDVQEIVEYDSQQLIPFILSTFDPHNFQHCLIVQHYTKLPFKLNVDVKTLSEKFNSKPYQVYELLSLNYADHKEGLNWEAFKEYKRVEIDKYTLQYSLEEYKKLLKMGQEILNQTENNHEKYQLVEGLLQIFNTLSDRDINLYIKVMTYYLSKGEQFKLHNPILLVKKLINALGFENTIKSINKQNFQTKLHWLFACYQALPDKQIQAEHIANLYKLYEKAVFGEVPRDFSYLLNYLEKDSLIIVNITKILVDKALIDKNFGYCFSLLFNQFADVNNLLESLFKGNESILKQAYLAHELVERHADFNGQSLNLIINIDPNFLLEYVDYIYSDTGYSNNYNESRDYYFLWQRDNTKELITSVIAKILSYGANKSFIGKEFLKQLFFIDKTRSDLVDIKEKQNCFLKSIIENHSHNINMMSLIFNAIAHFEVERRSILIAHFLTQNQDIENFKTLSLEPNSWGWEGSAVPMIAGRIAYWQNLLPYCNSINLLAHRQYIEDNIRELQRYLEAEKKSDFIND